MNNKQRQENTKKRKELSDRLKEINVVNLEKTNCLHKTIHEIFKQDFYKYLGTQKYDGLILYNCEICKSTISNEGLVHHVTQCHYREGLNVLRKYIG